jgi:predicted amidohydrolase YtcJ
MKQLFTGGRVFTAVRGELWAEALVIDGERIAFVGSRDDSLRAAGSDAEVVDLAGGVVVPGFVDAHAHVIGTGGALTKAQLRDATSLEAVITALQAWVAAHPDAPRVLGTSWVYDAVPGGRPTRHMLDTAFPDRPVYLEANDFHSTWVNSAALREMGITSDTPDPVGGEVVRDPATREATGWLLETAANAYVYPVTDRSDDATLDAYLAAAMAAYTASGVTTAVDMGLSTRMLAALHRAETSGSSTLRVIGHWLVHRTGDLDQELAKVAEAVELAERHRSDLLRIAGIKIVVDGTIDGCTAALSLPYSDGTMADPIWDPTALTAVVTAADAAGLQVALHAIGDHAVHIALDALEHASRVNGTTGRRHRIEHLEYAEAADIARLGPLGVTASMQPVHLDPAIMPNWVAMLGPERAEQGFAWPEYLAHGATLAFGTDTPTAPHEPLPNMYLASTRRSPGHPHLHPHRPDWARPLDEAVVHATADAAWASFADTRIGSLQAGMLADLVVLDRDPFAAGPDSLLATTVTRTVLGGRTVHRT